MLRSNIQNTQYAENFGYHSECPKIDIKTTVLLLELQFLTGKQYEFYKGES
jgi:hypothetical protein